jgi:hypothetical protein
MSVTPKRNSVRPEPCRHGDRREIHQVHEVGVGAEAGIELHGVGKHLRNLEGGTSGRQEQEVNFRPFSLRLADHIGKLVEGLERLERGSVLK